MSRYYHPTTLEHIPNPLPRVTEWASEAPTDAPQYDWQAESCRFVDGAWVVEILTTGSERAAEAKIAELKTACRDAIFAGFNSDALGSVHHYPCKQGGGNFDQINLNGQVSKSQLDPNGTFKFICEIGGVWARREHTAAQIQQVGLAGATHVTTQQDKLEAKLAEVAAIQANSNLTDDEKRAQINAITW